VKVLAPADVDQFIERGWCAVEGCFTREAARAKVDRWIAEQGFTGKDPLAWGPPVMHRGLAERFHAAEFAPKAYAAAEDLVGAGAIESWTWGGFIVNVSLRRDRPWTMPRMEEGWHVDGDFFHHFLDSREQSLLAIQVFTDMRARGGCTVIAEGSYRPIARMLREHPEGLDPQAVVHEARRVVSFKECPPMEVEAEAGTVIFLHPLMLHASSPNTDGPPRFIMNAVPIIREHYRFDRPGGGCVVERATVAACGGRPFSFVATGERRRYTPNRERYERPAPAPVEGGGT
jgi:hypothetical protein